MLIRTHWNISEAIMSSMEAELIPMINPRSFQLGCVLTDFFWNNPDHTKTKSFYYLSALIDQLQRRKLPFADRQDKQGFSGKLGITCHYICDYFCQAHNDPDYKLFPAHFLYEARLQTECKKYDLTKLCRSALKNIDARSDALLVSLPDYIQTRHLAYISEKPEMKKDIFFAVETSTLFVASLMDLVNSKCRYQAA